MDISFINRSLTFLAAKFWRCNSEKNDGEIALMSRRDDDIELYVSKPTDNEDNKGLLLYTKKKEIEEIFLSDLSHCVIASGSFIREVIEQRFLESCGKELEVMDIRHLRDKLFVVHKRAHRFIFPVASDPNYLLSTDLLFVEPEIKQDIAEKQKKVRARYTDILGCIRSSPSIKRVLLLGEFGSGKNTLCAKLVLDIINNRFSFLDEELGFCLYISCDLSKFPDWNEKSFDELLIKFCHGYSTNNRFEDTEKLLEKHKKNILCIFSGYEHLKQHAKEKVDFVLQRKNGDRSIFCHSTIVMATSTDPAFNPCFLTYFDKFYVLSRISRDNADSLLNYLFQSDIEEKKRFLECLKKLYLTFLLEVSPLFVIYTVYVYQTYGTKDRNQFVVELVYLMKDNMKDRRSFLNHRVHIANLLKRRGELLPNADPSYGWFSPKESECYEYLTEKSDSYNVESFNRYAWKNVSPAYNLLSATHDQNLVQYNQQVLFDRSFDQIFHKLYFFTDYKKYMIHVLDSYFYLSKKYVASPANALHRYLSRVHEEKSNNIHFKFVKEVTKHISWNENIDDHFYTHLVYTSAIRFVALEEFLKYVASMQSYINFCDSPILFLVMFYVYGRSVNKSPSTTQFLTVACRTLWSCLKKQQLHPCPCDSDIHKSDTNILKCYFHVSEVKTTTKLAAKIKNEKQVGRENWSIFIESFSNFLNNMETSNQRIVKMLIYMDVLDEFINTEFSNEKSLNVGFRLKRKGATNIQGISEYISDNREELGKMNDYRDFRKSNVLKSFSTLLNETRDQLRRVTLHLLTSKDGLSEKKMELRKKSEFRGSLRHYEMMLIIQETDFNKCLNNLQEYYSTMLQSVGLIALALGGEYRRIGNLKISIGIFKDAVEILKQELEKEIEFYKSFRGNNFGKLARSKPSSLLKICSIPSIIKKQVSSSI